METLKRKRIIKPAYYGNWSDMWGFPLAYRLLPLFLPYDFITPNLITLIAFILYLLGSILLFIELPYHLIIAAVLLPLAFVLDDVDGQLARAKNLKSEIGNYLDKVLDVLKIYILTFSLSYAVYSQTQNVLYIYLGFTAAFFFMYRYYIKLESVMHQVELDPYYLKKSTEAMRRREAEYLRTLQNLPKTLIGRFKSLWFQNRIIFFVDEAEFAIFTSIGALLNRLDIVCWVLAISQVLIATWRFYERGIQTQTKSEKLYYFMRK